MFKSKIIIGLILGLLLFIGLALVLFRFVRNKNITVNIPILMYHAVTKEGENIWCVPLDEFERQMEFLHKNNYITVLPSDVIAFLKWGRPLPKKPIMLTFDDGYLFNLTIIEPVLQKHGFKGVIYLITSLVDENGANRKKYKEGDCLIWKEVLEMQKRGTFVFGGHSHEHINLATAANCYEQVKKCKEELEKHHIKKPLTFCYPGGQYNEEVIEAVRANGFVMAMACKDEIANIKKDANLFALPRVSMMGGKHSFQIVDGSLTEGKLTCKILHQGLSIPISARLYIKGYEPLFLPPMDIPDGVFELKFSLPAKDIAMEQLEKLEIWDKHGLFLLRTLTK